MKRIAELLNDLNKEEIVSHDLPIGWVTDVWKKEVQNEVDKYIWHNSLDFPEPCKNVLCFCRGNQYQVMSHLGYRWFNSWNHQSYMDSFVIAWREIEQFEGVEK